MNRASGTCGNITKDSAFVSLASQKEGRAGKVYEELMPKNFPNLVRHINLQNKEAE